MIKSEATSGASKLLNVLHLVFLGAGTFLVLLALLHILEPELDPSRSWISQYELGRYGWIMILAFSCLSLASLAMLAVIRPYVRTISGRIGLILLAAIGIALIGAAIFSKETFGNLHNLCAIVVIPGFPIAITLIGGSLSQNQSWVSMRHRLPWMTALVWSGFLAFIVSIIIAVRVKGGFGPDMLIGWPNRFMMVSYSLWFLAIARWCLKIISKST